MPAAFQLLLGLGLAAATRARAQSELYRDVPTVLEADGEKLDSEVRNRTSRAPVWVVEFYSHSCGHCRNFKPYYVNASRLAAPASELVQFAAVDCEYHWPTCNAAGVRGYPTVHIVENRNDNVSAYGT